jgi:hypothetical protein
MIGLERKRARKILQLVSVPIRLRPNRPRTLLGTPCPISHKLDVSQLGSQSMEEIDIWRAANQMIVEHGGEARPEAMKLAAKMLERGDHEGYEVWALIWTAIKVLQEKPVVAN